MTSTRRAACNLCAVRKFKCEFPGSSRPPRSLPSHPTKSRKPSTADPKSDPPARAEPSTRAASTPGPATSIPKVVIPPLSSVLGRRPPASPHTSQEIDELPDSPAPPKRRKPNPHRKLPTSTPPRPPSRPPSPDSVSHFEIPAPHTTEPSSREILGRPLHAREVFPELIVPSSIVDRTPQFVQHRGAYWQLEANKIPQSADGFRQVRASMSARLDLIRAQEKESRALLAAAQYNVSNAL